LTERHHHEAFRLARKADVLGLRANLISAIRRFFDDHGFLEIDTPVRLPSPAPEEHIEALPSGEWFLQTSPELCMKRLLAAGYPHIYQICKCFRKDERGALHLPEFTLLEWYVAGFDYLRLMDQCRHLIETVMAPFAPGRKLAWRQNAVDLSPPWKTMTVADAFSNYAPLPLQEALQKELFDDILTEFVEPHLGLDRPVFLFDYPSELAALARIRPGRPPVAERFELYIGGMELANGFSELTDAHEQRRRFEDALARRAEKGFSPYAMPEKFLDALPAMPDSAGVAVGVDRLVMLAAGADRIDEVVAFAPEDL